MKIYIPCYIILFFCLVNIGQANETMTAVKSPAKIPQQGLMLGVPNEKYGLDCFFYEAHDEPQLITNILIYERMSSRYKWYEPYRDGSIDPFSFYKTVWSPDTEYLVLPLGRDDGFHVLHASQALEDLNEKKKGFVKIDLGHLPVWHTFWKWVGDDAFLFSAGHAYTDHQYIYEIGVRTLSALPPAGARYAMTEHGRMIIEEKKDFTVLDDYHIGQMTIGMTQDDVLRYGEPVSPRHLPVWIYPSREGYYHYLFYFWPTNEVEPPTSENADGLRLFAITKKSLEDRDYVSEEPYIAQEYYIFPEHVREQKFTGLQNLHIKHYEAQ